MTNEIVVNILDYLRLNIKNEITIDDISKALCYDKYYLMKVFKKEIGVSIISYVNMVKICNSLPYYSNSDDDYILKISMASGYNSQEYYSEMFRLITGVTPSIYKKYCKNEEISERDRLLINKFEIKYSLFFQYIRSYKNGIKDDNTMKLLLENNKK